MLFNLILTLTYQLFFTDSDTGRQVIYLDSSDRRMKLLKRLLHQIGCFQFYKTNSGEKTIGVSQIIYFLYYGKDALANHWTVSKGEYEVHHIDGDVSNNHHSNLIMLHVNDHREISKIQLGQLKDFKVRISIWISESTDDSLPRFNRRGRLVKNPKAYLQYWLVETVVKSVQRWVIPAAKRNLCIKEIVDYVDELATSISNANYSPNYSLPHLAAFYHDKLAAFYHDKLVNTIARL